MVFHSGTFWLVQAKQVSNDAHRLRWRKDVGAASDVFLEDIVLHRARELANVSTLATGNRNIKRQQNRRRRVDGHRSGDFRQIDAIEEALHVLDRVDRDADFSNLANGQRVIGIQADLGGQVEGDRKSGGAVGEQVFVAFVGFLGVAHAGVLAHGPKTASVHGGLDAAGVGIIARVSDVAVLVAGVEILRSVERPDRNVGGGLGIGGCVRLGFGSIRHYKKNKSVNHEGHEGSRRKPRGVPNESRSHETSFVYLRALRGSSR